MAQDKRRILWWHVRGLPLGHKIFLMIYLRHVAKTGEITDFVITEESGIAKGIRRITAITGEEAVRATQLAETLKTKLDQLEKIPNHEKDAALKAMAAVRLTNLSCDGSEY